MKQRKEKNQEGAQTPEMQWMSQAHGFALSATRQLVQELNEYEHFTRGDTSAAVLAKRVEIRSRLLARSKSVDNFFDICLKTNPSASIDEGTLLDEIHLRPKNVKRAMSVYTSEYQYMVRNIKNILSGKAEGITIWNLKNGSAENIILEAPAKKSRNHRVK